MKKMVENCQVFLVSNEKNITVEKKCSAIRVKRLPLLIGQELNCRIFFPLLTRILLLSGSDILIDV